MSDLIDRQAAINALARIFDQCEEIEAHLPKGDPDITGYKMYPDYMIVWEYLHQLPSAQPELDEWCTDCKEYDQERHCCPRWNRVIRETLKDAGLERKKGRWQITDAYPHNVYCSECHVKFAQTHWAVWEDGSLPRNFCPNCGADMRGE